MSWQLVALDLWLRGVEKPRLARARSVAAARARMERTGRALPRRAGRWPVAAAVGRRAGAAAGRAGDAALLWLHGGAYCVGSPRTHLRHGGGAGARGRAAARCCPTTGWRPSTPFPAAVEDARAAWEGLLAEGVPPGRIALGGDSAGGGLAFALLRRRSSPAAGRCRPGWSPSAPGPT